MFAAVAAVTVERSILTLELSSRRAMSEQPSMKIRPAGAGDLDAIMAFGAAHVPPHYEGSHLAWRSEGVGLGAVAVDAA